VWVSLGVIAGLVAVRLGYPAADPLIALVVAAVIAFTALKVLRQSTATLSDSSRIPSVEIVSVCSEVPGVLGCHQVRTRGLESEVYVDMHILVEPTMSVDAGHAIAEKVESAIRGEFGTVVDVVVHVEPFDDSQNARTEAEKGAGLV
jgi:cation diffusion facilitator family transporter